MISESLIRLDVDVLSSRNTEIARRAIAAQVDQFLSRGGEIEVLPANRYDKALRPFNSGQAIDPITGHLVARASRSMVGGRMVLSVRRLESLLQISATKIRTMINAGEFPAAIRGLRPMAWDEEEVLAWMEAQG